MLKRWFKITGLFLIPFLITGLKDNPSNTRSSYLKILESGETYVLSKHEDSYYLSLHDLKMNTDSLSSPKYSKAVDSMFFAEITEIKLDTMKSLYQNPCIIDGLNMLVANKERGWDNPIQIKNYYHPTIDSLIEKINKKLPNDLEIYYNKKVLLKEQKDCDKQNINSQ